MLKWIDPDRELPPVTRQVLVAVGTKPHVIDRYNIASVGCYGAFYISNGPYSDCCLYSGNSKHRTNNAYRVIAWADFGECDVDLLETQCPTCGDYHDTAPRACETGDGE